MDELGVEGRGRLGRIGEAPADLLRRRKRKHTLDLVGKRLVERLFVNLTLGAGHRLVLLVGNRRRNRDNAAAEVRAARIEDRRLRALRNLAVTYELNLDSKSLEQV